MANTNSHPTEGMASSSLPVQPELLLASCSTDGRPVFRNDAWQTIFGDTAVIWDRLAAEDASLAEQYFAEAASGTLVTNQVFLVTVPSRDEPLPVLLHFLPVFSAASGTPATVQAVTVTGEALVEPVSWTASQTRRNRLEALGKMTLGIIHDVNNQLMVIDGHVQMLRELGALQLLNESVAEHMQEIERASLDAAYQIASLQQYIKHDKSASFESLNLSELVEDCIKLTYPYWHNEPRRHGIDIRVEQTLADVPPILGSPTELRNVCVNLILNAVQAMPEGGLLRFTTRHDPEVGVQFTLADSGIGMPDHVRQRIFEPLFTTKGEQGNGMGLAVSLGIVRAHDGDIHVDSAPGRGTTFNLTFPTAQTPVHIAPPPVTVTAPRTAHILVVDDDPKVLNVLVKLLQTRGHNVERAESGREALAAARRRPPDVVITDLGMPDMNGRQLAHALRDAYPTLPVILVTGDTDTGQEDDTIDAIINKPFKIKDLDTKIQSLICQEMV